MRTNKENSPEIQELINKAKQGDFTARQKLITDNIPMSYFMARKRRPDWLQLDEAESIALYYLIVAVDNYIEKDFEYPLSTIIWRTIEGRFGWSHSKKESIGQYREYLEYTTGENKYHIVNKITKYDNLHYDYTEDKLQKEQCIEKVTRVLSSMSQDKATILKRYYGIRCKPMLLKEIAIQDNISDSKAQVSLETAKRIFKKEWIKQRGMSVLFY